MGKQIKSSATTWDSSEMGSAPVGPVGTVRLRPKSDSLDVEVSYNGAAYVSLGGGGSTPRLDQVLDPMANKSFSMSNYQLAFQFAGADAEDEFVIESATNAAGSGVVLLVRTQGTTSTKAPLRVDANGTVALTVDTAGNVGIRSFDSGYDFNVAGNSHFITTNTDDVPAVEIETTSDVADGCAGFTVANNQVGTLSTNYVGIDFTANLQFASGTGGDIQAFRSSYTGAPSTSNRRLQNIVAFFDDNQSTDVTGSYTAFYATQNLSGSETYTGVYRAFYARNPASTWAGYYGYIAESGLMSGFGLTSPTATLHASGTVRLDFGSDARGDSFYRASTGNLARLAIGTVSQVWTVTDIGGGILEPRWATPAGGGGSGNPAGSGSEIQFRSNATTFGAVTSSAVSGADVTWAGFQTQTLTHTATSGTYSLFDQNLTLNPAGASSSTYRFIDCGLTVSAAQTMTGGIRLLYGILDHNQNSSISSFKGTEIGFTKSVGSSVTTVTGHEFSSSISTGTTSLNTGYSSSINGSGGTLSDAKGFYAVFDQSSGTFTKATGFKMFASGTIGTLYGVIVPSGSLSGFGIDPPVTTVHVSGTFRVDLGSDAGGDIFYRSSNNFTRLAIGTSGFFLKSNGSIPGWAALAASDIASGTLALARGGTGSSLVDPNADRILFWDDSAGAVDWLTAGTGLTITGTTITASGSGSPPAGSGSEIQYRVDGSTFGAVTSSSVSGADVTWAGLQTQTLTKTNTSSTFSYIDQNLTLSPASSSTAVHRLIDHGVTFGTAQNTSEINLRYSNIAHNQTGTLSTFYIDQIIFAQSAGTTSVINGYVTDFNVSAGTTSQVIPHYASVTVSGGTITSGIGYYIDIERTSGTFTAFTGFRLTTSGTIGTLYGCLMPSGALNGFGLDTPVTTMHVSGTFRVDLTSDATGDTYYRNATPTITRLAIGSSGTFYKSTGSAPSWASLAASDIASGTLSLARGGTGSSLVDPNADRIMFWDDSAGVVDWLAVSTGLTITGTTLTASGGSPAGSGTELQYRNAGAFGAVSNTSVSGSTVTLGTSTDFAQIGGSAAFLLQGDAGPSVEMRAAGTSAFPLFSTKRARGTWASKSGLVADDLLYREDHYGYYDSTSLRLGGQAYFTARSTWSSTEASTIFGISTIAGNQTNPVQRLILGGRKTLTDNTLTDLFTVTFNTTDHVAGGGELHLVFVAKQTAGSVQTHIYRRKMTFIIGHNGATNTSMFNAREESGAQASAASDAGGGGGFVAISHAINSDSAVAISTAIPSNPNVIATNTITYKMLADSNLTTISQFIVDYHIVLHGEINLTLS